MNKNNLETAWAEELTGEEINEQKNCGCKKLKWE